MTSPTGTALANKTTVTGNQLSVISNDFKPNTEYRLPITSVSPYSGFTLVEVCLVGLILSIIFTISWPVFNHIARRNQLEILCNEISYTMRYARDYALNESKYYSIQFDTINRKYYLSVKDNLSTNSSGFTPLNDSLHKTRSWPDEIQLNSISSKQVLFYPDGSSDDLEISFKNAQGNTCKLKLNGSTGFTTVTAG